MASKGAEAAESLTVARQRMGIPLAPGEGETILWQGQPRMMARKLLELAGFLLLLGLLSALAVELIVPHFAGSDFAGTPDTSAVPLILLMLVGTLLIIGVPVWLRSGARARARYMLTNRRALVWLGNRIIAEAILFGAEMRAGAGEVSFVTGQMTLSWRLKDEGEDRLRVEQIAEAPQVAALAEAHGAIWIDRPEDEPEDGPENEVGNAEDSGRDSEPGRR